MKNRILFLFAVFIVSFSQAQTGIISLKSHSGQLSELTNYEDNFGNPPMDIPRFIPTRPDTMTYLGNNCVQIKSMFSCDTLCNNSFFKEYDYNPETLKDQVTPGTIFKDFEKRKDESHAMPMKSRRSHSQIPWMIILLGIGTFGLAVHKKRSV